MRTSLQLHLSVILAAMLIAYLTARGDWLAGGAIFVTCFAVIEGSVMLVINSRLRRIRQEEEEFRRSLDSVPLDEARFDALAAVVNSNRFVESDSSPTINLPATVMEIFSRYKRVVFSAGDFLELGSKDRGFVHVGRTFDGAELIVREADEGLFEWEGPDLPGPGANPDYPSVFHWIVRNVRN